MRGLAIVAAAMLALATPAVAQRVTFGSPPTSFATPGRSDIGLGTAGNPELDYVLHCQGCHRADGSGTPGAIPQLAGHMARFLALPGGREFLVRVPGVAQSTLDDDALAALLNWMIARFDAEHVPATFSPYTAAEVAALRSDPLVRVSEMRAAVLAR